MQHDFDLEWKQPTQKQLDALTHGYRAMGIKQSLQTDINHYQLVLMEAMKRTLAVDMGANYNLTPYDLAEVLLLAEKSLWYAQALSWATGEVPFTKQASLFKLAGESVIAVAKWGYQEGVWWYLPSALGENYPGAMASVYAAIWTIRLSTRMAMKKSLAVFQETPPYILAGSWDSVVALMCPKLGMKQAITILNSGGLTLLQYEIAAIFDKQAASDLRAIKQESMAFASKRYEPIVCINPTCTNLIAPFRVPPRDGHYKNYGNKGACSKACTKYECTHPTCVKKAKRQGWERYTHGWETKIGQRHKEHALQD